MDAAPLSSEGVLPLDFRSSQLYSVPGHMHQYLNRKLNNYNVFVVSKTMYGLDGMRLSTTERRGLGAFHTRCLRRILNIPHPYYSRVSNAEVLHTADVPRLSLMLKLSQSECFTKVAKLPFSHPIRSLVFDRNYPFDQVDDGIPRKQGRPRLTWTSEIFKIALQVSDSAVHLRHTLAFPAESKQWISTIHPLILHQSLD